MDEAELRFGGVPMKMRVQKAEFWHKQGGERKVVDRKRVTKQIGKRQGWVHRNVWCRTDVYHGTREIGGLARSVTQSVRKRAQS